MRILVVDDEQLLVKGIKFNLENEGWQVDACYDGAAAVEQAKAVRYDLIILDLMMPVMDGLEACMHIRQQDPSVPIIMLTAKSEDTDKLLGFEYGADDYITKPFNILLLKARIRALLRRSGLAAAPAAEPAADRLFPAASKRRPRMNRGRRIFIWAFCPEAGAFPRPWKGFP